MGDTVGTPQIQGEVRIPRTVSSVEYRGVFGTLSTMVRTEGARSLYNGLAAGLQRQMSFASIRIGLYDSVKQLYSPKGAESECPPSPGFPAHPLPDARPSPQEKLTPGGTTL